MRSRLMVALLSLLVVTSAEARKQQVYVVQIDGTCDTFNVTQDTALMLYASAHIVGCASKHAPSSNPIPGVGIVVKQKGTSTARELEVTDTEPDIQGNPIAVTTELEYPIVTGSGWKAYATSDGKTITQMGSGTYTVR